MTVLDAVLAAGGVNEFAAPDRSSLYRRSDGGTTSYAIRLDKIINDGDLSTNFPVAPGDIITVPERAFCCSRPPFPFPSARPASGPPPNRSFRSNLPGDRKSVVRGNSVSVSVCPGGRPNSKHTNKQKKKY